MLEVQEFKNQLNDFICSGSGIPYHNLRAIVKGFEKFKKEVKNQLIEPKKSALFSNRLERLVKYCLRTDKIEESVVKFEWFLEVAMMKRPHQKHIENKVNDYRTLFNCQCSKINKRVKQLIEMLR